MRRAGVVVTTPAGPTQVFGTIVLSFVPTTLATVPEPAIGLTLIVRSLSDRSESRHVIAAADRTWVVVGAGALTAQDFSLTLGPGMYEVFALEVDAPGMNDRPFHLGLGAKFSAPIQDVRTLVGSFSRSSGRPRAR